MFTVEDLVDRLVVTAHAKRAMRDRDVTPEEVVLVLVRPDVVEPHEGKRRFVKDDVVVVVSEEGEKVVVVTVLWREQRQWTSAAMRGRVS